MIGFKVIWDRASARPIGMYRISSHGYGVSSIPLGLASLTALTDEFIDYSTGYEAQSQWLDQASESSQILMSYNSLKSLAEQREQLKQAQVGAHIKQTM